MKIRTVFGVICGAAPLFLFGSALAQPSIFDTQGLFNHGESVTIVGDDFGIKSPAAPLRYDNFEDGTLGEFLPNQSEGGWYTINHVPGTFMKPTYSKDRQRVPGEMVVIQDYSNGRNSTIGLMGIDANKIYMSGWTYRDDYEGTAGLSENQKLWGNFGKQDSQPQARVDTYWGATGGGHIYTTDLDGSVTAADWSIKNPESQRFGRWFRLERYMHAGTGNGTDNSWVSAHDMGQVVDRIGEINGTFYSEGLGYDYWILGHYFARTDEAHLKVYYGELYVDNTLARVEIGNAAKFGDCTHREIQIPTAWNDDSLTFTANLGTFNSGEQVYLFVVDENDNPSAGFSITLGEGVPMVGPGQPGQPVKE
jgi:hypothetical protein